MYTRGKTDRNRKVIQVILMIAALGLAFVSGIFVGRIGYSKKVEDSGKTEPKKTSEDVSPEDASSENVNSEDAAGEENATKEPESSEEEITFSIEETSSEESSEDTEYPVTEETVNSGYMDDFSDAVFIGDSRTQAFMIGSGLGNSHFYCEKGINVASAMTDSIFTLPNGGKGNLRDALSQQQFARVYVMFGANELGWPDAQTFVAKYLDVILLIKELQPQAKIYVQSILPVSQTRNAKGDYVNNVNIANFNQAIYQMTLETGTTYLPVGSALANEVGCLPENASVDGVHPNKDYCMKWMEFLKANP